MTTTNTGSEAYVVLHTAIHPGTVLPAVHHLNVLAESGVNRIVLLVSTPGGGIDAGVFLYTELRALAKRCTLVTYAIGEVNSMGVGIYLAGDERVAGPYSSFLLHRPTWTVGETPLDADELKRLIAPLEQTEHPDVPELKERLDKLEADEARTAAIYQDRTPLGLDEVRGLKDRATILSADEAVATGIVHRVEPFQLPSAHSLVACGNPGLTFGGVVTTVPQPTPTSPPAP